jgi:hypothetical protein
LALAWLYHAMRAQRHPKALGALRRCAAACAEHGVALDQVAAAAALSMAQALAVSPSLPGGLVSGGPRDSTAARDQLWACLAPSPPAPGLVGGALRCLLVLGDF